MHNSIDLISHYIPSLFKIFSPGNSQKKRIIAAYENRLFRIQQSIDKGAVYEAKETLFDLLWDANATDEDAYLKLEFIERTISSLNQRIPLSLKSGIGNICYRMIVDVSDEMSSYFNYLSELATLNKFVNDGQTRLLSHELSLPNGKTMDFQIQRDGDQYLIEVYTILINPSKIACEKDLMRFIEKRLEDKLNSKFYSIENLPKFILVPVLWISEGGSMLEYANVARRIRETYGFISYFMIYGKFHSPSIGKSFYEFITLEKYVAKRKQT